MDKLVIPTEFFEYANQHGEFTLTVGQNGTYDIIAGSQVPNWAYVLPYILMVAIPIILGILILGVVFAIEKSRKKKRRIIKNEYIKSHCNTIITSVKVFEQSCNLGATQDDGYISKDEKETLKEISKACQRFTADIGKLMK